MEGQQNRVEKTEQTDERGKNGADRQAWIVI
jgi:hypothetical protein